MKAKVITPDNLFVLFSSLSLLFHVFNNLNISEGIKVFHLFALLALVSGIPHIKTNLAIHKRPIFLIICTFISSFLSRYSGSLSLSISFFIIVTSTIGLNKANSQKILLLNNILAPFVIAILLYFVFQFQFYRFQGFYDDPNYLCTTLLVYLYLIIIYFTHNNSRIVRILLIVEMLAIFIIISYTISRTGMLCAILMLFTAFSTFFIKSWKQTILLALLLTPFIIKVIPNVLDTQVDRFEERIYDSNDNAENAADYRRHLSQRGIDYVINHPQMIPFGIGLGALAHNDVLEDFDSSDKHGDHNTFTACFTEQGLFAFLFLISFFLLLFKFVYYRRKTPNGYLKLMAFLIFLLFGISINQTTYLPFWWMLFYLANDMSNENPTRRVLRTVR